MHSVYLSIVIPLYNESESIDSLVAEVQKTLKSLNFASEILLIDDGSTDDTWQIIERHAKQNPSIIGIKFRRNFGQTPAMVAGFDYASGKIIITMDGDLQNDPADIPQLLDKIEAGYDIVSGWRKYRRDHFSRTLLSQMANAVISFTTGVHLHDYGCSLKAYRADCIQSLEAYGEMHRFFPALASITGAKVTEIPVRHHPRRFGASKYGFERIFKVFVDIFSLNLIIRFSAMPLIGFAFCSIPFLMATFFFGGISFFAAILDWTPGKSMFFLISSILSGMTAFHLIIIGVIGELIVGSSDLSHSHLPEITKKKISIQTEGHEI